ncbi:MAG: hypothetical protein C4523_10700 [Myxococcales bacterium]|nr:MAG: hypothetical protein C4523_10700 [Myxococcales bacterium]
MSAMAYDVMNDIVVKQGIRSSMIEDMRSALEELANWRKVAKQQGFSQGAKGAEERAQRALKRFRETWKKL